MASHLATIAAVELAVFVYVYFVECVVNTSPMSGDRWYMRQFAFVGGAVSPPYCWRPLLPLLARYLGFGVVSYSALLATPFLLYGYAGGGWIGVAVALAFVLNPHVFRFGVRNPEYDVGLTHLLLVASLWAMAAESPLLVVGSLLLAASCVRESAGLALAAAALLYEPPLALIPIGGMLMAYSLRNEDKENRHPLVERGAVATVRRWAKHKGQNFFHFAHVVQPLRGLPLAVPFVWFDLGYFARVGLVGFLVTWACALPASGQCRIVSYSYAFFVPVVVAFGGAGAWAYALLACFWPLDYLVFDETGGQTFSYVRGSEVQQLQSPTDNPQQT